MLDPRRFRSPPLPQRRDRVGIWAPNSLEWTVLQYAAARVRAGGEKAGRAGNWSGGERQGAVGCICYQQ